MARREGTKPPESHRDNGYQGMCRADVDTGLLLLDFRDALLRFVAHGGGVVTTFLQESAESGIFSDDGILQSITISLAIPYPLIRNRVVPG